MQKEWQNIAPYMILNKAKSKFHSNECIIQIKNQNPLQLKVGLRFIVSEKRFDLLEQIKQNFNN